MKPSLLILLATSNPHKVREIQPIFQPSGIRVQSLSDAAVEIPEPVEDQPTFAGNALLKARYYAQATGQMCLADDSGLVVDALRGEPGVRSARYAGISGPRDVVDPANNHQLIERLRGVPDDQRTARFVCAMALVDPRMIWVQVTGVIDGRIIDSPRGSNGFGYDPHFLVPELGKTTAELPPEEKNAISHRGRATRLMLQAITELTA